MEIKFNNNIQIVLAEDNLIVAALTIKTFRKCNVENEIIHFTDGASVIDFIFNSAELIKNKTFAQPKIFLLDINMPKMDGIQVLKKLKENIHTKQYPVVMFSSSDSESDIIKCYQYGANSYLVKPVSFSEFLFAIKQLSAYWLMLNKMAEY
jgi:two-component system response regulator